MNPTCNGSGHGSNGRWTGSCRARFVTAVLAEVSGDRSATLLNYGHPAPVVVRPDGAVHFAAPPRNTLPLGLDIHGKDAPQPYDRFHPRRSAAALYRRRHGGPGPQESLLPPRRASRPLKDPDPETALQTLRRDLVQHVEGPLHDDAAMLLLRYHRW